MRDIGFQEVKRDSVKYALTYDPGDGGTPIVLAWFLNKECKDRFFGLLAEGKIEVKP